MHYPNTCIRRKSGHGVRQAENIKTNKMSKQYETGHPVNIASLDSLITYLKTLQPGYQPINPIAEITSLEKLLNDCQPLERAVNPLLTDYNMAVKQQEILFKQLPGIVTRTINAFEGFVADEEMAERARSLARQINSGGKSKPKDKNEKEDDAKQDDSISTSHRSYDQQLSNFDALIKVYEAAGFNPKEDELTVKSLNTLHDDLSTATQAVDAPAGLLKNARIARDAKMYNDKTGIITAANAVKSYVKSKYGAGSPEIKYVNKLKFRTY